MAPPGLTLGPQDIDSAGELTGRLGVHNKAGTLLKRHAALYPMALRQALALPIDLQRTEALDVEEVLTVLNGLKGRRAFFDEEVHTLEDASVRTPQGNVTDDKRVVSVVFRAERDKGGSGRSGRGVIPYSELTASIRAYEEKVAAGDSSASSTALANVGSDGSGADAELAARVAALETATSEAEERARQEAETRAALEEELARLRDPEPWEGYDEANGDEVIVRLREGGLREFGEAGLERIRDYEEAHKNRKGVLGAVQEALNDPKSGQTD